MTTANPSSLHASAAPGAALDRTDSDVVLIVDDVPDNLAVLHDALDESGYTVLVATHGEAALQRAAQALPDIVLLDAMMPGMDGFEVARRLKASPATAHIPIIFMTGLTETEHVVAAFAAGGTDYVTKPIRAREVIARITAHSLAAREQMRARHELDAVGKDTLLVRMHDGQTMRMHLMRAPASKRTDGEIDAKHPLAWYGRRMRDVHDVWHVLTGYGTDGLGEACVVAFSYSQTKSLGFALIAHAGTNSVTICHLLGLEPTPVVGTLLGQDVVAGADLPEQVDDEVSAPIEGDLHLLHRSEVPRHRRERRAIDRPAARQAAGPARPGRRRGPCAG